MRWRPVHYTDRFTASRGLAGPSTARAAYATSEGSTDGCSTGSLVGSPRYGVEMATQLQRDKPPAEPEPEVRRHGEHGLDP